ncbi:MAG: diguanylate cyclase [Deltaproteobacteria bacterium]|nr:MAG: diguanylate cyclase [Deltaproteobacteria bacterium]
MKYSDPNGFPPCKIDFPLDFSPQEIATLTDPINTLLKCNSLLGTSVDFGDSIQSLFDIAGEVAGVDCCAYISVSPDANDFEIAASRNLPSRDTGDKDSLLLPAALARSFNKGIHLEAEENPHFAKACKGWEATSLVAFPLRRNLEFIGALVFGKREIRPFTPVQMKLLWVLVGHAENLVFQGDAVKTLSFYSFFDPLTHLYNRRYFDELLEKEILRSSRNGKPVSLVMLDIDGFKAYNDAFLPSSGDIALQEVATILQGCVREVDTVARLGGDEFAIILLESNAVDSRILAQRIIERLGRHRFPGRGNVRAESLSASAGIATFPADAFDQQDLAQKSAHALQMARHQGGGKVCLYQEISGLGSSPSLETSEIPVQKIFAAARSVVDMDRFLEILLFTAMQGLSAGRGSIVVTNSDGNFTLRAAIGFGNGEEQFGPGTAVPAGTVTSWVTEKKEPLLVTGREDLPLPMQWKRNGYESDSFLSIPLLEDGRLLGILHLTNKKGNQPFTRDDLTSFEPLAREITSILSQGILFRENVKTFSSAILRSLSTALELRFPFLGGHGNRVQDLSLRIGKRLGLPDGELATLGMAATLHDIGIVGIPGEILTKSQKLTDRELEIARKHPFLGAKMLEGIPGMEEAGRIILEHQEYFDGSGYPYGLRGEEISLGARIVALAEFYDSITSSRPHRGGLRQEEALQLVRNSMGTIFDERICRAFLEESRETLHS